MYFYIFLYFLIFGQTISFFVDKTCFLGFSSQSHAESSRNFVKKPVLNPKHAKFNPNSSFGHVRAVGRRSAAVGGGRAT